MSGTLADRLTRGATVHLDSMVFIYYIEQDLRFTPLLRPLFERIEAGELRGSSSVLSLVEVMVKPLRARRGDLAEQYRDLLASARGLALHPVDRETTEESAAIRAAYNFKVPDAIQLATAQVHGAEAFVTNDMLLRSFTNVGVLVLEDLV